MSAREKEHEGASRSEESRVLPIYPPRGKHSGNSIKFQTLLC